MENMQEYLKDKLEEFNKNYNVEQQLNMYNDKDLKRRWKSDHERAQWEWQFINDVTDVNRYINGFIGSVKHLQNIKGIFADSYDMNLALYKAILAIRKMAQCYEFSICDFGSCSKEDIDAMFDTLYQWLKKMNNVNMRRAMQD